MNSVCYVVVLLAVLTNQDLMVLSNTCISSCNGVEDGSHQSCQTCDSYFTCFSGFTIVRQCVSPSVWHNDKQRCDRAPSPTCSACTITSTTACAEVGGKCTDVDGTAVCECIEGYVGDGINCEVSEIRDETYSSCWKVKSANTSAISGTYVLHNDAGESYNVYCEFYPTHIYEYIQPSNLTSVDISDHYNNQNVVMLRYRLTNGTQFEVNLEQIRKYRTRDISVQYNNNSGYADIHNTNMGPYLYVGLLPVSGIPHMLDVQGYSLAGRDHTFINCDGSPNSYIALLFNEAGTNFLPYSDFDYQHEILLGTFKSSKTNYKQTASKWINGSSAVAPELELPVELFSQFEIRMGGCGGYITSALVPEVAGMTIGFRYDMELSSCKDVYDLSVSAEVVSGDYYLTNDQGETYKVYCEFVTDAIYTFVAPNVLENINIDDLHNNQNQIAIRYRVRANRKQFQSMIGQITRYKDTPISIQYNTTVGYNSIRNSHLYPYLYVGLLPIDGIEHNGDIQGYSVNGENVTFTNCDGTPNSYFALLYNSDGNRPRPSIRNFRPCFELDGVMTRWIRDAKEVNKTSYLPANYFTSFEMQLGGCGGYLSLFQDPYLSGVAFGLKYDLTLLPSTTTSSPRTTEGPSMVTTAAPAPPRPPLPFR